MLLHDTARSRVGRTKVFEIVSALVVILGERVLDEARNVGKPDPLGKEEFDGGFVRGVENRRSNPALAQCLEGEPEAWEAHKIGLLKIEAA